MRTASATTIGITPFTWRAPLAADNLDTRTGAPHPVRVSGPATETSGRETRWLLTDESTGARTARVTAVERTGPENPGTPASRDNDRLVVVTEGKLTAEIAARRILAFDFRRQAS